MTIGVVVFPGSNCDHDCQHVLGNVLGQSVRMIWHKETSLKGLDAVVLPGGFSYGDYLRTGAIARFSPVMGAVKDFAKEGGAAIGICNGFQILLESGLLPGAMLRNRGLQYRCEHVHVRVEQTGTPFTSAARKGQVLTMPIGHGEGNYYAPTDMLDSLEANSQVVLRYTDPNGAVDDTWNPNGSVNEIAAVCNAARNVVGMMPHPERACEPLLGGVDGRMIFESVIARPRSAESLVLQEPAALQEPAVGRAV